MTHSFSADTERILRSAVQAGQKRDYKKAIKLLESITEPCPQALLYLARSWHSEKNFSRAVYYMRMYIRKEPADPAGWFFLARSYCSSGLYTQAIRAVKKSLQYNPDSADALSVLAFTYLKVKQTTLALSCFEKALILAPESEHLHQGYYNALFIEAVRNLKKGNADLACQMCAFLLNNDMNAVIVRLYYAHALRELGNLPQALIEYRTASQLAPEDSALRWYEVSVLFALGKTQEAQQILSKIDDMQDMQWTEQTVDIRLIRQNIMEEKWQNALQAGRVYIKKYGSDVIVHTLMGESLRSSGNMESAENHFRRAIELDRTNSAPHYGLLMVLLQKKDYASIESELLNPSIDSDTLAYYTVMCMNERGENPQIILDSVQKLIPLHPLDTELLFILASQYLHLGLLDLAQSWYERALRINNRHEEAFLGYIVCLEHTQHEGSSSEQKKIQKKLYDAYADYLSLWQDNVSLRRDFILFLEQNGNWEQASDETEKIISFTGYSEPLARHLALYRRKAGQYRAAALLYRSFVQKNPADTVSLHNLAYCLDKLGATDIALQLLRKKDKNAGAETFLIEASLYLKQGNTEKALDVLRNASLLHPADYRIPLKMSIIYTKSNIPEMSAQYAAIAKKLQKV